MQDSRIENTIYATNAKLLILDPLQAYLGRKVDINRANETREITKSLSTLAERTGCAIILIGHMNKGSGTKAMYRGLGSIDIAASARSVLLVGRVPDNSHVRAIVQTKSNLALESHSMAFKFSVEGFEWLGRYDITSDELLGNTDFSQDAKFKEAVKFLKSLFEKSSSYRASDIAELSEQEDIKKRTLNKAKKALGIESIKEGDSWNWTVE